MKTLLTSLFVVQLICLGLAACSTSSDEGNGGNPEATDAATQDTNQNTDGGDAEALCDGFEDSAGKLIKVLIKNERKATIYVGSRESLCNTENLLEIRDSQQTKVVHETASCYTCASAVTSGVCVYSCGPSPLYRVDAGTSITVPWNGTQYVQRELPAACHSFHQPGDESSLPCPQEIGVKPGRYTIKVTASSAYSCKWGECTAPANGETAQIYAYGTGDSYVAEGTVELPAQDSVTVVFQE